MTTASDRLGRAHQHATKMESEADGAARWAPTVEDIRYHRGRADAYRDIIRLLRGEILGYDHAVHVHVNSGVKGDDSCAKCGRDLRDPIHVRESLP